MNPSGHVSCSPFHNKLLPRLLLQRTQHPARQSRNRTQPALIDVVLARYLSRSRTTWLSPYAGVQMKLLPAAILAIALPGLAVLSHPQQAITWRFDNLTRIGDVQVTTLGNPQVVDTSIGKAIHFAGRGDIAGNRDPGHPAGDALLLNSAPLSGDATYTFEVIFRPSSKGAPAQRFFHMQDTNSASRRMFEIRIVNNQWCLDTVGIDVATVGIDTAAVGVDTGHSPEHHGVTLACDAAHLHPLDRWFAVAATYDGKTLRGYVNGELQGQVPVTLAPLPPGTTSVGARIDHRDFFTGDIYSARFTSTVLPPSAFLKIPISGTP